MAPNVIIKTLLQLSNIFLLNHNQNILIQLFDYYSLLFFKLLR